MIQPLKGRVLIQKTETSDTTDSGIVLVPNTKTSQNTTTSTGTIAAVVADSELTAGAVVIFDEGWGNEVEPGLFLVPESSVKAVVS